METTAIERSVWINAPRERVWQAIIDPDQVEQWFSPGTAWRSTGLSAGDRLYVPDPESGAELYAQVYDVIDPPHRLVTHAQVEPPQKPTVTTWTLEEENGGTRLTLVYSGYEALPEAERQAAMDRDGMGFTLMLGNIQALIEGKPLPNPGGF